MFQWPFIDISSQCLKAYQIQKSETLLSATIKAANEAVLAASKERSCVIRTCVTIYKSIIINNCSTEFFEICNLRNFNSSKFKFCLFCKNFCFENNPLYGISVDIKFQWYQMNGFLGHFMQACSEIFARDLLTICVLPISYNGHRTL